MSRTVVIENATVKREYVAPTTVVHWDPVSNNGTLVFHVHELLYINGELVQSSPKTSTSIELSSLIEKTYQVEVAPGVFQDVPGGLIMLAFKAAFEEAVASGQVQVGVA